MQNFLTVILTMMLSHEIINAENTWPLPPIPTSSSKASEESSVVVDLEGNTVAVWSEDGVIKVSELPLNGNWSMPASLSTPWKIATNPKLEVDPNGNATLIWAENDNIKAALRPFGGNWTEAKLTPAILGDSSERMIDLNGNAIAVRIQKSLEQPVTYEQLAIGLINSPGENNSHSEEFTSSGRDFSRNGAKAPSSKAKRNIDGFIPLSKLQAKKPPNAMSTNAIDAPSGATLTGAQIGFAAGTSAPSNGLIVSGSVSIGSSSATASAALSITSTTQGFLPPLMNNTQQNAIASPASGLAIFNSSLGMPTYYNGSQWNAPGMELITRSIVSGSSTSTITFNNINQNYFHLKIIFQGRSDSANTNNGVAIRFNNDSTAAQYKYELIQANNASVFGSYTSTTYIYVGELPAATGDANYAGGGEVLIPEYIGTTFYKTVTATGNCAQAAGTRSYSMVNQGSWLNTTNITRIDFINTVGNFVAGTTVSLYGIR